MTDQQTFSVALYEPEQGHRQLVALWPELKAQLQAGKQLWLEAQPLEEARDLQRNREYWGYVLRPISEQAQIDGIGATVDGWHDYYTLMFLGYAHVKVRKPGAKRVTVRRVRRTTTQPKPLSNREMRKYMEQVRAHAATTFGVTFPVAPWVAEEMRRNAVSAPARKDGVVIDNDTGEILQGAPA